jgi:DNA-binding LacI/PurR family transcriptional regulator
MTPSDNRPTIRTVAARAGVSKSLVSLVLQDSPKVSPTARAAVQAAIDELGYRPNLLARSLSAQRTGVLGVVLHDLRNPWYVECLEGLASVAGEHGYRPLLADSRLDQANDGSLLDAILRLHVDGLVLLGTMEPTPALREALRERPSVVVAARDFQEPHTDVVANDDASGIRLVLDHLLDLGHRDIAHIDGGPGAVPRIRRESFVHHARARGLEPRVVGGDTTEAGGYAAAAALLAEAAPPTAILAWNDITAIGALSAARAAGLSVPGDVSVTGYDDSVLAALGIADLTSIDTLSYRVGELAAEALVARIADPSAAATELLIEPRLVVRGSTAPPRS